MNKIVIFGNSGSGKSTLAKKLSKEKKLAHFDLDTIAWLPTTPPTRRPLEAAKLAINEFFDAHDNWVIEGCYADLLNIAIAKGRPD